MSYSGSRPPRQGAHGVPGAQGVPGVPGASSGVLYLHTQIGWALVVPVEIGCLACLYLAVTQHLVGAWIAFVLLSLASSLFFGLTVAGTQETLTIRFGAGLVKKTFKIKDISSIQPIKTTLLNGWGVRLMCDRTWLFNVSGFKAVKLTMLNGRSYAVGSDEPEKLIAFLESVRRS